MGIRVRQDATRGEGMLNVVTMPIRELTALVELGAAETGLPEAIIEKDLWVCYILDHLFLSSKRICQLDDF